MVDWASTGRSEGGVMADSGSILGNAVVRLEDPTLLTGSGKYVDDLDCPGATRVVFVRSSVAHGVLRSVDVEAARSMPGVVGAVSKRMATIWGCLRSSPSQSSRRRSTVTVFARDRVRFVGDIVAAVVAETGPQAVDAGKRS